METKRISNINSFSSILDRLIIENLKIIQFTDQGKFVEAEKQNEIIYEIKKELDEIYIELSKNVYKSIKEQRTYTSDNLFSDIFKLCLNNYCIAKGDKLKVAEVNKNIIDINALKFYVTFVRQNLEERAKIKNSLEDL